MTCSAAGTVLLETPPHGQEREGEEADECCHALTQDTLSPCSLDCPITAPAKKQEFFQESHLVSQAFRVSGTLFFPFIPEEFFHLKSISGKEPVYLLCLAHCSKRKEQLCSSQMDRCSSSVHVWYPKQDQLVPPHTYKAKLSARLHQHTPAQGERSRNNIHLGLHYHSKALMDLSCKGQPNSIWRLSLGREEYSHSCCQPVHHISAQLPGPGGLR